MTFLRREAGGRLDGHQHVAGADADARRLAGSKAGVDGHDRDGAQVAGHDAVFRRDAGDAALEDVLNLGDAGEASRARALDHVERTAFVDDASVIL